MLMVDEWRFRKRSAQEVRDEVGMGLSYNQGDLPQSEYKGYGRLGQPSPGNFEFGLMNDGDDDDDSWAGSKEADVVA